MVTPNDGDVVSVRALWPMPGTADGSVVTVSWGPHLAVLVGAGRYELQAAGTAPAASAGDGGAGDDGNRVGDGDAVEGDRPVRRGRGR